MDASGKRLGSSLEYGKRFQVTELASGTEHLSLPHHMEGYQAARFSPDDRLLAASSFEGVTSYTLVYDVTSGEKKLELRGHSDRVTCIAFHPAGNRLATGSGDKTVKIWDLETGIETLTLRGHSKGIEYLEFRSDGRELMTLSSDGEVRLWGAEKSDPGIARPNPFVLW
jgi:WD40 repeat protein